jgi:hypothetical protein
MSSFACGTFGNLLVPTRTLIQSFAEPKQSMNYYVTAWSCWRHDEGVKKQIPHEI